MMKRFCACLLTALLMMSSAFAAVGVDAFVADKDENYIPIPAAYEVYTTFKNLDDYGFMNHPEDIFIGKDNLIYVADTENNRVLVMNREGVVLEEITEACGKKLSKPRGVYVGDLEQHLSAPTTKLLMMAPPEQIVQMLAEAQAQFGESVALTCSKPYFLEVNPPLATKGHALSVCAEEMGFPLSQCMAFGDSLNDVSMLRAAGYGVCMGNGREDVKRMGFAVCGTNQEDGVARYIQQILFD